MASTTRVRLGKDPWSALTHFFGFVAAIPALVALVLLSRHDGPKLVGMTIYGASLVGVFLTSSAYHFFDFGRRGNEWLRKADHAAIFLLIAGTYMPPMIHLLDGTWRIAMISMVGGLAIAGVIFKLVWVRSPKWLSTAMYLGLGWAICIPAHIVLPQLSGWPLFWIVAGGLSYTVGAVVYVCQWPDPWPDVFGHHEVWHLFVLFGAGAHFVFTCYLLGTPYTPF